MNRVFHVAGIAWVLASLAVLGSGWPAAGLAGTALLLLLGHRRLPLWMGSAAAAVFFCSLTLLHAQDNLRAQQQYIGTLQSVRGVVTDLDLSGPSLVLRLTDENPAGLAGARLRLHCRAGVEESIGDVVEYAVRLDGERRAALLAQGLDFEAFGQDSRPLGRIVTLETRLSLLRQKIASRFTRLLPRGEGALLSAVLLGRTQALPNTLRQTYARAGLSHLLAVSGLHLSVLLSLFGLCLRQSWLPRRVRLLLEMLLALSFAALTGFPPSIVRAALMLVLHRAALLLGRDADALNSLGFSIIPILLLNPHAVFSLSLQLSYLATMGICSFAEPMAGRLGERLREERPRAALLLNALCVTLAAQILTTPLTCWQFGQFPLLSPVSNLLSAIPAALMLLSGMTAAVLGFFPVLEPLCRLVILPAGLCARFITWLAGWLGWAIPVQNDGVIFWMAGTVALFLAIWRLRCRRIHVLWAAEWAACTLAAALCAHLLLWGHPLIVCVTDYGETVLLVRGGQAALLGSPSRASEAERLLSVMKDSKVKELCLFISVTVPDETAQILTQVYPPTYTAALDSCDGLKAELFGCVALRQEETGLRIRSSGFELVKTFGMTPVRAHILVNGRNEVIAAPGLHVAANDRYYGCTRLFLPAGTDEFKPTLGD